MTDKAWQNCDLKRCMN